MFILEVMGKFVFMESVLVSRVFPCFLFFNFVSTDLTFSGIYFLWDKEILSFNFTSDLARKSYYKMYKILSNIMVSDYKICFFMFLCYKICIDMFL